MSKVKRLNFTVSQFESVVPYASEHGQYVRYADYAKLEAEAHALREEVERSEQHRNDQADLIVSLRTEVAALKHSQQVLIGSRNAHRDERDAARKEVAALRARVAVVPDRLPRSSDIAAIHQHSIGWNACLDELARLNGLTVSEGLLRRVCAEQPATCCMDDEMSWRRDRDSALIELRALLSEQE
ncbi:hypothetical protein [Pseudomonas aeruginosa]|uniref:hypothetical protein n=1 Tax=Pseudomonas aeruginosa TaxID=287 RepID=UPI000F541949|nr:hypothetical protein [Pseudomonas aeruginosa]RQE49398.1 hypothetical protein IPC308_13095 [Pseudomonas aeruginosa]